mmetsp:Transcript_3591/g.22537  ORF Transcript_3591/g.22537 Transcript_3591/m.22537 type:complete len:311 (-) Transcript_3591:2143-3075(-)|eukprot:CAMPEP_0183832962 /NCGR_PEP_ID=MMETSP0807_2-20130328/5766_1 /TAXON_ID=88271 /ORGANISM="Picocystis salinarum, Strain CCMP1897" /LENGTH=310 /DNA_ID=CAMNT_0026078799 /DNA_START=118 /DNA_END=1050 /DNA_ORIENTATION=+
MIWKTNTHENTWGGGRTWKRGGTCHGTFLVALFGLNFASSLPLSLTNTAKNNQQTNFPYLYVNDEYAKERRLFMEQQFEKFRLEASRVQAIRGDFLPKIKFPSWLPQSTKQPTRQELGCLTSHLRAINEGVRRGWDRFVVVEDDIRLRSNLNMSLIWATAPKSAGLLILGVGTPNGLWERWGMLKNHRKPWTKWKRRDPVWGTLIYSITRESAKRIQRRFPCNVTYCNLARAVPPFLVADYTIYSSVPTFVFNFPLVDHMGTDAFKMPSTIHSGRKTSHEKASEEIPKIIRELNTAPSAVKEFVAKIQLQ